MSVFSVLDPSAVFCLFCILVPLYKEPTTTDAMRRDFLLDPYFILSASLLFLFAGLSRIGKCPELSVTERMRARWYLWNGAIIHVMMDGGIGALKQLPLFLEQYKKLDGRFRDDSAYTIPVQVAWVELLVMAPLCFLTYLGFRWGKAWAAPLEIVICTCHIFGAVMFCLDEHVHGYPNIVTDPEFTFTPEQVTYFWFGYFANFVWIVLPIYLMTSSFAKCTAPAKLKQH